MNNEKTLDKGIVAENSLAIIGGLAGASAALNVAGEYDIQHWDSPSDMIVYAGIKVLSMVVGGLVGGTTGKFIVKGVDKLSSKKNKL